MNQFLFLAFNPGVTELIIVLAVVLLLFGPKKLPALSRSIGKSISEFKRGRQEIESELEAEAEDIVEEKSSQK